MLIVLRIIFGAALLYEMAQGAMLAPDATDAGDLTGAFYLVVCVGLGLLNALVWAPYLGNKVAGPIAGTMTEGTYVERINWVLRMIQWFDARGYRRLVCLFCFLEGVRHPSWPTAFAIGLRNARPRSWLQKVFAREVFRFSNTQNCVRAYLALKEHGIDPRPHSSQEVNIILMSLERPPRPEPEIVKVPQAPPAKALRRNPSIRLFKRASDNQAEAAQPSEDSSIELAELAPAADNSATQPAAAPRSDRVKAWFMAVFGRIVAFLRAQ